MVKEVLFGTFWYKFFGYVIHATETNLDNRTSVYIFEKENQVFEVENKNYEISPIKQFPIYRPILSLAESVIFVSRAGLKPNYSKADDSDRQPLNRSSERTDNSLLWYYFGTFSEMLETSQQQISAEYCAMCYNHSLTYICLCCSRSILNGKKKLISWSGWIDLQVVFFELWLAELNALD